MTPRVHHPSLPAKSDRSILLDLARGLAALIVVASHARAWLYPVPPPEGGPLTRTFLFLTGLPFEAVMVFFVISGYFVGGSVVSATARGDWSWSEYGFRRLTRLWIVLLPALLLTAGWDNLGNAIGNRDYYIGALNKPDIFLGNLFFLQYIHFPVYGSNGPLWSLAYEFWYYLLFPMIYRAFVGRDPLRHRVLLGVGAAVLLLLLPRSLAAGGLVWLMGIGARWVVLSERWRRPLSGWPFFLLAAGFFGWVLGNPVHTEFPWPRYSLGFGFACMVPFLATRNPASPLLRKLATLAGGSSYTLYLAHFPFLVFLFQGLCFPAQPAGHALSPLLYAGLMLVVGLYTGVLWFAFERRTDRIRKTLREKWLPRLRQEC